MSLDGLTPGLPDSNFAVSPLSPADELLHKVYGDHLHDNDGRHLTGGISAEDNAFWMKMRESSISSFLLLSNWFGFVDNYLSLYCKKLTNIDTVTNIYFIYYNKYCV